MYRILNEIRDLLKTGTQDENAVLNGYNVPVGGATVTSFDGQPSSFSRITVQPKTNTGDVKEGSVSITGTDFNGNTISESLDFIDNDTRKLITKNEFKTITQIVFPKQDGSTSTWNVGTSKFNVYYVGNVSTNRIHINATPALMVYPVTTALSDTLSTCRDRYEFEIGIKIVTNAFLKVDEDDLDSEKELKAQKEIMELMEQRDSNNKPEDDSVLGVLRNNIQGTFYLFNNDINIEYQEENVEGKMLYMADLRMSLTTRYNNR